MRQARFTLQLSADEILRYYRGQASMVSVRADDGIRLRFPASCLRQFVTPEGIRGRFVIRFDEGNRLLGIDRIAG